MSKEIITIYPCRDFSTGHRPPLTIKANVPRKALLLSAFQVAFKVAGEVVTLTNGYVKPEWSRSPIAPTNAKPSGRIASPLPKGEGQGEGKGTVTQPAIQK